MPFRRVTLLRDKARPEPAVMRMIEPVWCLLNESARLETNRADLSSI